MSLSSEGFFKIQKFCIFGIGYRFDYWSDNYFRFAKIIPLFNTLILVYCLFAEVTFIAENVNNIKLVTDALAPLLTGTMTVAKLFTFFFKKNKFIKLATRLQELRDNTTDAEERVLLDVANKRDQMINTSYLVSTFCTGLYFIIYPLAKIAYLHFFTSGESIRWGMPMKSSFFFDISTSPTYELMYSLFSFSTFITMFGAVGVDSLFSGCVFNMCAHLNIVQGRFMKRNLADAKEMHSIIAYHSQILDLCMDLNEIYAEVVLTQFLITSLQLCAIGFQLTLSIGDVSMVLYICFIVAILIQLFIYAYGGSKLIIETSSVGDAIYASAWYQLSPQSRKTVLYVLMRSQKFSKIKSGFYVASLSTFSAILSSSASYITLLQTLDQKFK